MLDQAVYEFGTRLSFLQLFQNFAPVLQLNKIYSFRPPRKTAQHINIYYYYIAGKILHQISPGKAAVEKTGRRVQKSAQ
jgi:hypothetical protein